MSGEHGRSQPPAHPIGGRHSIAYPHPSSLVLVLVALVPFLGSDPGQVVADSRQYLYIDPGAFLARAASLWDPSIAAGTVPHQHLGFLWPMGPWFWLADTVGLSTWFAQRLWLAGIAAAAGLGMLRLCRALGVGAVAALVAALAYQLTPYQLAFTARFSVLLLPWAALPWLMLLSLRAVRERSWRAPLMFGLVAATAGSVNASSLLLVLVAPAVILFDGVVRGDRRRALLATARISVATLGASAWWLAGLLIQGRYGLPILQLTENVDTVAGASRPDDVIRGLGNWIFTSTESASTAIDQAPAYTDSTVVRAATIALPATAIAVLVLIRVRGRGALAAMLAVATVIGVGAAPLESPSRFGELWSRFSESSSIGLALRNTPRIVPVIVAVTAIGLAVGIDRVAGRYRTVAAGALTAVIVVAISPVLRYGFLDGDFERPEEIPQYWHDLAADLDAAGDDSRVLVLPGSNFAAYDWGNTVEPVLPGLVDRPVLVREVLPAGGAGTVDLLAALDRHLQRATFEPETLAPVARLFAAGEVVIRGDLDNERFGLPDPQRLVRRFIDQPPPGFTVTGTYGGTAADPLLLRLSIDDTNPRLRADAAAPVVLAGSGDGIVDAAAAGLVDGRRPVLPAAALDEAGLDDALDRGAGLVVTDTNRKRATTFFYTIVDDTGATETAARRQPDPTSYDVRFGPYDDASTDEQTVAVELGGTVTATVGGGPEHPEDRAVLAFDGDPATAWRPRAAPVGQRVQVVLDKEVPVDAISLRTAPGPAQVTEVALSIDGERTVVALDDAARDRSGQRVDVPDGLVGEVTVEIVAVDGPGVVGIAEIGLVGPGPQRPVVDEVLRAPTALVDRVGRRAGEVALHYVFTRELGDRTEPADPPVEVDIDRFFDVPVDARFTVRGSATVAGSAPEGCDDTWLRIDGDPVAVRVVAGTSGREQTIVGCDRVRLSAGSHRLTTARAGSTPVVVNRVVVGTGPPSDRDEAADPVALTVTDDDRRHLAGTISGPAANPFWLVLAESGNDGWHLDVGGAAVVSTTLVDGYANGWLLDPDGNGPVQVELTWTPQRLVWAGFAVSGSTVLIAAVVLARGRRRLGSGGVGDWLAIGTEPMSKSGPGPGPASGSGSGMVRSSRTGALIGSVAAGMAFVGVVWFVSEPVVAAVAAAALGVRIVSTPARILLAGGAAAAVVAAELTDRPSLVFVGLALLGAEVVADACRHVLSRRP